MQLIKIDSVQPQSAQAAFAGGSQVFWLSVFNPLVGTRPHKAALSGDHQSCRIRVQRLSDDFFANVGTVGVCGIDKIDSQFDGAPQNPDGLSPICGLAPPVIRIAPNPRRVTRRSFPIRNSPDFLAGGSFRRTEGLSFCIGFPLSNR